MKYNVQIKGYHQWKNTGWKKVSKETALKVIKHQRKRWPTENFRMKPIKKKSSSGYMFGIKPMRF